MCWMTIRREDDALAKGIIAVRRGENISGGHSWGYAYTDEDGLHFEYGLGEIPDEIDVPVTDNALVHTRFATQGNITLENSHPMIIRDEHGDAVAAMAHNGTWRRSPDSDRFSDTWFMARQFEHYLEKTGNFEDALKQTTAKCGETLVILRENGDMYVYAGRFKITRSDTVVQSSGFGTIDQGTIIRIDPDGFVEEIKSPTRRSREGNWKNLTIGDFVGK